ncbi:hypothetical protein MC7420_3484 [Coleofasciculus chthonoplastes PCC 7420]|uniref:Uncharacterized protein n=1 Tax=Coleofasciculus chthonoplastes PCC 7420 TaxID=118168 RepID=B4W001_9CYAN|nr:hypothetical protein MC7420_3484 [Coleofasciculus chthonoplastes PCC 7420]
MPLHELLGIASTLDIPSYFSRDLEYLSPNLSPARREALNSPPCVQKKSEKSGYTVVAWQV